MFFRLGLGTCFLRNSRPALQKARGLKRWTIFRCPWRFVASSVAVFVGIGPTKIRHQRSSLGFLKTRKPALAKERDKVERGLHFGLPLSRKKTNGAPPEEAAASHSQPPASDEQDPGFSRQDLRPFGVPKLGVPVRSSWVSRVGFPSLVSKFGIPGARKVPYGYLKKPSTPRNAEGSQLPTPWTYPPGIPYNKSRAYGHGPSLGIGRPWPDGVSFGFPIRTKLKKGTEPQNQTPPYGRWDGSLCHPRRSPRV